MINSQLPQLGTGQPFAPSAVPGVWKGYKVGKLLGESLGISFPVQLVLYPVVVIACPCLVHSSPRGIKLPRLLNVCYTSQDNYTYEKMMTGMIEYKISI